eukprot:1150250-Pelagomonas_calceolata.AAC.2
MPREFPPARNAHCPKDQGIRLVGCCSVSTPDDEVVFAWSADALHLVIVACLAGVAYVKDRAQQMEQRDVRGRCYIAVPASVGSLAEVISWNAGTGEAQDW